MELYSRRFFFLALLFSSFSVLAGGTEQNNLTPPQLPNNGLYLEGNVGYVSRDWGHVFDLQNLDVSNRQGGITGGADVGYQFTEIWSLEFGWMYLPTTQVKLAGALLDELSGWFLYSAAKISVPINNQASVFAKLGVSYSSYSNTANSGSMLNATKSEYWAGYFALGAQYYFNANVSIDAQFTYVPGLQVAVSSPTKFPTPNACLFTLGLGYKFIF